MPQHFMVLQGFMCSQENIDEYCKALVKLPAKISESDHVRTVLSAAIAHVTPI